MATGVHLLSSAQPPPILGTKNTTQNDAEEHYGPDDYVFDLREANYAVWVDPTTGLQKWNRRIMTIRVFTHDQSGDVLPIDIDLGDADKFPDVGAFQIYGANYDGERNRWQRGKTLGQVFDMAEARRAMTKDEEDIWEDQYGEEEYQKYLMRVAEEGRAMRRKASTFGPGITVIRA